MPTPWLPQERPYWLVLLRSPRRGPRCQHPTRHIGEDVPPLRYTTIDDQDLCSVCYYKLNPWTAKLKFFSFDEIRMCELLDDILHIRGSQHDRLSGTTARPIGRRDQHLPVGSTNKLSTVDYYVTPEELKRAVTRFRGVDGQLGHHLVRDWLTHARAAEANSQIFRGVVVEYDGEYYHQGERRKTKDCAKRDRMLANGYLVYKVSSSAQGLLQSHDGGHTCQIYSISDFRSKKIL